MFGISAELRRRAREVVARTRELERTSPAMLECPSYTNDTLMADINAVLGARATELLATIDVEALAGGGVRMGELTAAGFRTVADVLAASPALLSQVPGVGERSAETLLRRAQAAHDEAMLGCAVHLDAEGRPAEQTALLRSLYRQEHLQPVEQPIEVARAWLGRLSQDADQATCITGLVRTIVTSREMRERAAEAVTRLESELPLLTQKLDEISLYVLGVISVSTDELWGHFELHAADYYARISALAPVAERERTGRLPEGLAQQVDAVALDTTLLRATLRPYQVFGAQYAVLQERTLIGDEMGLGKTVEAIAAMAHLAAQGGTHFMVVCPLSVLLNWEREVPRHSALRMMEVYGPDRDLEFVRWCKEGGVAITTYETTQRLPWDTAPKLDLLVVDEAHYVKNPEAKRTRAVVQLLGRSRRAMLMTGTPLENRVGEMTALVSLLDAPLAQELMAASVAHNPVAYRRVVAPRYLRRTREDVLAELPSKVEKTDWCAMSDADRADYLEALRTGSFADLRRVGWRHGQLQESAKAVRLRELVAEARSSGRKVLVYTYFLSTLSLVGQLLGDDCAGMISGSVSAAERQRIMDEFVEGDRCALACQVTAGGQGVNLQAASVVIFCEPQLKPSAEAQAVARAYRMGQVRTVVVHRLLMADTVDERIDETLRAKAAVFGEYAQRSEMAERAQDVVDQRTVREIVAAELARHGVEREAQQPL